MAAGGSVLATVAVLGLGPSGRAVTHRLAARGVDVVAVDLAPDRAWRPTYATWADELPDWLPAGVISTSSRPTVFARTERVLERTYVVLDTTGLQQALDPGGARVLRGRVAAVGAHSVELADGTVITADLVIDARGSRLDPAKAQQTAYGLVVTREQAAPIGGTWFMDWRADHGAGPDQPPSFLYAVPLDENRMLLEETCLVGRPPIGEEELRRRLYARLERRGVRLTGAERVEHVRFATEPEADDGPDASNRPLPFGARAGLMHPATGYSVAPSLVAADRLARLVADSPAGFGSLETELWDHRTHRVRALRRVGLDTLLRLPPHQVPSFFEAFFALPLPLQQAYLSRTDQPGATLAAMAMMAVRLPPSLSAIAVSTGMRELGSAAR